MIFIVSYIVIIKIEGKFNFNLRTTKHKIVECTNSSIITAIQCAWETPNKPIKRYCSKSIIFMRHFNTVK